MQSHSFTTILFDLDGTLLPLDQDRFIAGYFSLFISHSQDLGYDGTRAGEALKHGIAAMMKNDGSMTNKERFDRTFSEISGIDSEEFSERFAPFYDEGSHFDSLSVASSPTPLSRKLVTALVAKGYRVVLATSPLFPWQATWRRLHWAGLEAELFETISTYEEHRYIKPHLGYYRQVLQEVGVEPTSALMVGNDVDEDMVASELGMETYLVTDCLINRRNVPIEGYRRGSLQEFSAWCEEAL